MNARKTILVIEDDSALCQLVCRLLGEAGFDTRSADNLEKARLHLYYGSRLDAVVSDYGLPDGTGLVLLSWLRARGETKHLPVVLMSGSWVPESFETALLGFEFLPKPFLSADLLSALDRAFQNTPRPGLGSAVLATLAAASNPASPRPQIAA